MIPYVSILGNTKAAPEYGAAFVTRYHPSIFLSLVSWLLFYVGLRLSPYKYRYN
jgi:hypothetical protein